MPILIETMVKESGKAYKLHEASRFCSAPRIRHVVARLNESLAVARVEGLKILHQIYAYCVSNVQVHECVLLCLTYNNNSNICREAFADFKSKVRGE